MPQSNHKRNIFKYFNGEKDVYGDPILIESRFYKALFEQGMPDKILEGMSSSDLIVFGEAIEKFIPAVCAAFKVKPLNEEDGTGLETDKMIDLYTDFLKFTSEIKKNIENSPSSLPSIPDSLSTEWQDQSEVRADQSLPRITTPTN